MSEIIWGDIAERTLESKEYRRLKKTDVLVIGGGLCGLLCAYYLKKAGVDCMVADAGRIGRGSVMRSMARITSQHGLIYSRISKEYGREKAAMYMEANELALAKYRELAKEIDCDFEERDAYVYSRTDRGVLEAEMEALSQLGFDAAQLCGAEELELPFQTKGAIKVPGQAQCNPVKFVDGLIEKLNGSGVGFAENFVMDDWMERLVWSKLNPIIADKVICTTNFPYYSKKGGYNRKLYRRQGYVLALNHAERLKGMYTDAAPEGLSLRSYGDYLLLGGGSHRTGEPGGGFLQVRKEAAKYFPEAKEAARWTVQDCMSLDGIPYIGEYAWNTRNFFVATGFNQWGMTSSMAAALLLTDMVLADGKLRKNGGTEKYPWGEVFRPSRHKWNRQYFINWKKRLLGSMNPAAKKCTHGGCALRWNPDENTWDCPCHGSRFDENGKILEFPAIRDADVHPFSRESRARRRKERWRKLRNFFMVNP